MAATFVYINDSGANTWQIGVDDNGILSATPVSPITPVALHLNDYATTSASWLLGITTDGNLTTTTATFNAAYPRSVPLISAGSKSFGVCVTTLGLLQTVGGVVLTAAMSLFAGVLHTAAVLARVFSAVMQNFAGAAHRATRKALPATMSTFTGSVRRQLRRTLVAASQTFSAGISRLRGLLFAAGMGAWAATLQNSASNAFKPLPANMLSAAKADADFIVPPDNGDGFIVPPK